MGIDAGLSASGYTGKKTDPALFGTVHLLQNHVQRCVLFPVQFWQRKRFRIVRSRPPEHFRMEQLNDLLRFQCLQRRSAGPSELQEIQTGQHFKTAEQVDKLRLFRSLRPFRLHEGRRLIRLNGKADHLPGFIPCSLPPGPVKPQPRGEHHPHRVIDGAEITLAHEKREAQLLPADQWFGIRRPENLLTVRVTALFREGKHDSFRHTVSLPEGNKHTDAGLYGRLKRFRNPIVIRSVNGVGRR